MGFTPPRESRLEQGGLTHPVASKRFQDGGNIGGYNKLITKNFFISMMFGGGSALPTGPSPVTPEEAPAG